MTWTQNPGVAGRTPGSDVDGLTSVPRTVGDGGREGQVDGVARGRTTATEVLWEGGPSCLQTRRETWDLSVGPDQCTGTLPVDGSRVRTGDVCVDPAVDTSDVTHRPWGRTTPGSRRRETGPGRSTTVCPGSPVLNVASKSRSQGALQWLSRTYLSLLS